LTILFQDVNRPLSIDNGELESDSGVFGVQKKIVKINIIL